MGHVQFPYKIRLVPDIQPIPNICLTYLYFRLCSCVGKQPIQAMHTWLSPTYLLVIGFAIRSSSAKYRNILCIGNYLIQSMDTRLLHGFQESVKGPFISKYLFNLHIF